MVSDVKSSSIIRDEFLKYFREKHGHTVYSSSSTLPHNDPTLLFTNSGMNQFKSIFLGNVDPNSPLSSLKRVVNHQKCIRAGGKHNDLEDVGIDIYHHTFFEMLGNWSFGDYFKQEAIDWAWDLLTNVWKIPKERLYITYYNGDINEPNIEPDIDTYKYWLKHVPSERILPFGHKDNFWEMGDVGPCGPCSEIHYDRIGQRDASSLVNQDDPDVVEIWNLVFMQYNREIDGTLTKLPFPCIDTGMGLERITSVLQQKRSNYDTDVFVPIIRAIEQITPQTIQKYTGKTKGDDIEGIDTAYRVIADHIRTLVVAIADGIIPSNEGRGYVLRRILRRAIRYGHQKLNLNDQKDWFSSLVDVVTHSLGPTYPEIIQHCQFIKEIISAEHSQFNKTLEHGVHKLNQIINKLKNKSDSNSKSWILPGKAAFELYTTYGFPLDLTQIIAKESNVEVDVASFYIEFEKHQKISEKKSTISQEFLSINQEKLNSVDYIPQTDDSAKYLWDPCHNNDLCQNATIQLIWDGSQFVNDIQECSNSDSLYGLILDRTTFYAEAGGQVSDKGNLILFNETRDVFEVIDVQKFGKFVIHIGYSKGNIKINDEVILLVDYDYRLYVSINHTATHALNFILRQLLGNDCNQKGSYVENNKARFDYSTNRSLTVNEVYQIENYVKRIIDENQVVYTEEIVLEQAMSIPGIRAMFGEVYPEKCRVVSLGRSIDDFLNKVTDGYSYSIELCGGTHIDSCDKIKDFVILSDEAVSKNIRRIVFCTNETAIKSREKGDFILSKISYLDSPETPANLTNELKSDFELNKSIIPLMVRIKYNEAWNNYVKSKCILERNIKKNLKNNAIELGLKLGNSSQDEKFILHFTGSEFSGCFKLIQDIISSFRTVERYKPIILFSEDLQEKNTLVVIDMPQAKSTDEYNALTWVKHIVLPYGGRAGGKFNFARGTYFEHVSTSEIVDLAQSYGYTHISNVLST